MRNIKFLTQLKKQISAKETPFYVYDLDGLRERAKKFYSQLPKNSKIHFAMKANNNAGVLGVFHDLGFGVDVVSGGELKWALKQGFKAKDIVFSGVGKSTTEIQQALEAGVGQLNVESIGELERIIELAEKSKKKAAVALRLNPDVNVQTHPYIRTGFRENKFGIDFTEVDQFLGLLKKTKSVTLQGLALHIGSQIRDTKPFHEAISKTLDLFNKLKTKGFELQTFDVGGGVGIDYMSEDPAHDEKIWSEYAGMLSSLVAPKVKNIWLEPGRALVARFGYLITEVQYVKKTPYKNFVIVDTGMHHLLRPALYEAHHQILPLESNGKENMLCDVVGPICESSDVIGSERVLPAKIKPGDRLVIFDVGAYGSVMASDYNMHERPKEYVLEKDKLKET